MKRLLLSAILAVLAVPAMAEDKPAAPCLRNNLLWDFKALPGNRSLVVTDRFRKKYKLSLMGYCRSLDFNTVLGFKSFGAGNLSCISRGDIVISRDIAGPPDRCVIQKIEYYTPAMEKADALAADAAKAKSR